MTDRLRKAVERRQQLIDTVRDASKAITAAREARLASERATPKTTGVPLPEGPSDDRGGTR